LLAEVGEAGPAAPIKERLAQVEARLQGGPPAAKQPAIHLRAEIELEEGQKKQKRVYRFALPPGQAERKTVKVQMDRLAVELDLLVKPSGEITAKGSFDSPQGKRTFQLPPAKLDPAASYKEIVRLRQGEARLEVVLEAGKGADRHVLVRIEEPPGARKATKMRIVLAFREAPLKDVLERVAEVGGWRLELGSGVDPGRPVQVRVEASSAEELRKQVCDQLRLTCTLAGGKLRVALQPQ
jgi:hypothetical protein